MSDRHKVKFNICGYEFIINSEDSAEYIREIGEKVDGHISKTINNSPSMSTTMAAVFAALEFYDEATKSKITADNLRTQLQAYLEEASAAKSETSELRRQEQSRMKEIKELKGKLSHYETKQGNNVK